MSDNFFGQNWSEFGIQVPSGKIGQMKIKTCPNCVRLGKKKPHDSSLSIDTRIGKGQCWKCGAKFILTDDDTKVSEFKNTYTPPSKKNMTKLSERGLKELTDRMISQDAVNFCKVAEENGWLVFPYFHNDALVNAKYRKIGDKAFRQSAGGMQVMWNYEQCKGRKYIIITEGEMDALSYITAGFGITDMLKDYGVTSVSQGAPNVSDSNVEKKLECFTNSIDLFEEAELVYIAVDSDDNGKRLRDELIRRIDAEKIRIVEFYDGYKDANELLRFEKPTTLVKSINKAREYSPEGIFTANDVRHSLMHIYEEGLPVGTTTHFKSVDEHWKWRLGEVNLWTGYANEGKTTFLNQLCVLKAYYDDWKFCIFSPENMPVEEYYEDLIHMYVGKTMEIGNQGRMSKEELTHAIDWVSEHFFIIAPKQDHLLESIFESTKYLIKTKGIRGLILDPYNQIEHTMKTGESEHLYVSRFMTMLKKFAVENKISLNLVAHQNKPTMDGDNYKRPDFYNIKGGGTFADKADNVLMIWRPYRKSDYKDPTVDFIADKIKKKKLTGELGSTTLSYDKKSNRFFEESKGKLVHPMSQETIIINSTPEIDFNSFSSGEDVVEDESLPF